MTFKGHSKAQGKHGLSTGGLVVSLGTLQFGVRQVISA